MGIAVDVVEFTLNTGTGTQDITGSLGGLTPKAALFFVTRATVDGTAAAHLAISIGAATGTSNEWAFTGNAEDGQATTDCHHTSASNRCILLTDPGVSTVDMDAEFSAFITNGVRINITTASSAYKGICVLFAGSDLSAHANNVADVGNSVDTESNVTAPGFEPDLVFVCLTDGPLDTNNTSIELSFGICHNGVSITERCLLVRNRNNQAAGDPKFWLNTGYSGGHIFSDGSADWDLEIDSFDASGFSMFTRNGAGNNSGVGYLALAFAGAVDISLDTEATPTSTGNNSTTNPGFTPQAVIGVQTYGQSVDTEIDGTSDAGAWGISAFTGSTELCVAIADEDAAATTNTQSYINTKAIDVPNDDGTVALTADFVSMDANGYTLNWTDVEVAARQGFFLAIEEIAAGHAGGLVNAPRLRSKVGGGLV